MVVVVSRRAAGGGVVAQTRDTAGPIEGHGAMAAKDGRAGPGAHRGVFRVSGGGAE